MGVRTVRQMPNRTSLLFNVEEVRGAVATSTTASDALRALGLVPHADNFRRLREACERAGVAVPKRQRATPAKAARPSGRFSNDEAVLAAVRDSATPTQALVALRAATAGKNYDALDAACDRLGLARYVRLRRGPLPAEPGTDLASRRRARLLAMADADIRKLVEDARGMRALVTALAFPATKENSRLVREVLLERALPVPDGRGWNMVAARAPDSQFFVAGVRRHGGELRKRVLAGNLIPCVACLWCGLSGSWQGKPMTLELDHINGDRDDNRLQNLRFLCPNCHSQTPTFRRGHQRALAA